MNESKYYKARKKMPFTEIYRLDLIIKKPTLVSPSPSEKYEKRMLAKLFYQHGKNTCKYVRMFPKYTERFSILLIGKNTEV